MNIVLVNHYAGSAFHGMEYRPYELALEWVKNGHTATIIAAGFSHLRLRQPEIGSSVLMDQIQGIRYIWLKTPRYEGNGARRIINMLCFVYQLYVGLRLIDTPDVVIDSSTYPLTIYGSSRIAKKHGAKLFFEVHDIWPLTPMQLGGYSRYHPFIALMQATENYAYKHARAVISLLPNASEHMIQHGMKSEKFHCIPNGINISEWTGYREIAREHVDLCELLHKKDMRIVGYVGSHGISNALECLIEAAKIVKDRRVAFVLIGQGPLKDTLKEKAKHLPNVYFLPPVAKSCLPGLLEQMDMLYIGWKKTLLYRFGISPNKLLDYMMAAKPVIHSVEAPNDIVKESQCGFSVPPDNPESVAAAIQKMDDMSITERQVVGGMGRNYAIRNHDYSVLARKYLDILDIA